MDKEQLPARHQYHLLHGPQCPSKHCWAAKTGASLNAWVIRFVVAVLMALTPQLALSALDSWPYGLSPSYQRSPKLCERLFEKASTLSPCRLDDEICLGKKIHGTASGPLDTNEFIASHAYGYSDIYALVRRYPSDDSDEPPRYEDLYPSEADEIASALPEGVALLFLLQFGGASYQGLRETWKVDHAALQALEAVEKPLFIRESSAQMARFPSRHSSFHRLNSCRAVSPAPTFVRRPASGSLRGFLPLAPYCATP